MSGVLKTPGYRAAYGVNKSLSATNDSDADGNPQGGDVILTAVNAAGQEKSVLHIIWQEGPRATRTDGTLEDPNGAFVEDVLWAALQRLEYFNESKYRDRRNSIAITKIEEALWALQDRTNERTARGVEGQQEV